MRGSHFLVGVALMCAVGCLEPTATSRQGVIREGVGAGGVALAFTVQPRTIFAGEAMTPAVEVTARDGGGNRDTTLTGSITVAIGANPAGGTLSGTTSATAVAGVATFGGLTIDRPGTGYTLTAAASGATGATSTAFNVAANALSARR